MSENKENAEVSEIKVGTFAKIIKKIEKWTETDFFIPTFVTGSSLIDELICFLNSDEHDNECLISNKESSSLKPDIMFITGSVNYKKLEQIKMIYEELSGPKYVVTLGSMAKNLMGYNLYNSPGNIEDFVPVDLHIHGNPPEKQDILKGLNTLKGIKR